MFLKIHISMLIIIVAFITTAKAQCTLKNNGGNFSTYLSTTGNREIDNLITSEKIKLEHYFNVKVDIKIDIGDNGLALPDCQNYNCDGTIELGKNLLLSEFKKTGPTYGHAIGKYMVIAIMAHEFAHVFQYSHPELKFQNSVVQEIHADMLAGWYMAKYFVDNTPASERYSLSYDSKLKEINTEMTISFGLMGDKGYWSQQHHGNYMTRSAAYREGWNVYKIQGIENFSYFLKWSISTAEEIIEKWDND
jgi:hypothetical protein